MKKKEHKCSGVPFLATVTFRLPKPEACEQPEQLEPKEDPRGVKYWMHVVEEYQ